MIPRIIVYLQRKPKRSGSEIARDLGIRKNTIGVRINQTNKSKYVRKTGERIFSGGEGYLLLSQAEAIDLLSATNLRLIHALLTIKNTKDIAYQARIESEEEMLKITNTHIKQITGALTEVVKPLSKEEKIKLLENKIKNLKDDDKKQINFGNIMNERMV